MEGADPKVMEFLRILEDYRVKCEQEGNYLEAGRAHRQVRLAYLPPHGALKLEDCHSWIRFAQ